MYNIPNKRRRDHGLHEIKDSTLADQVVNQAGGESPNLYFKRSFNRLFCLTWGNKVKISSNLLKSEINYNFEVFNGIWWKINRWKI